MKKQTQEKEWQLRLLQLGKGSDPGCSCWLSSQASVITAAPWVWLQVTRCYQEKGFTAPSSRCKHPNTNSWMGGQAS